MDLAEELDAGTLTVRVRGEFDMATAGVFRQQVAARLAGTDVHTVVVNLGACTFTDSAGLTALVETKEIADREQVAFALTGVSRQVRKLLEVTSLIDMFTVR